MSTKGAIANGDQLWIHSPKTGWMKATAAQDLEAFGLAYLDVCVNSIRLPGVSRMTINVNTFDVFQQDDVDALQKIANEFVVPEWTR